MEVGIPVVNQTYCESAYPNSIDESMICAAAEAGGVGK